jgi:hypothetical protein
MQELLPEEICLALEKCQVSALSVSCSLVVQRHWGVIRRPWPGSVGTIVENDPIGSLYRSLIVVRAERTGMQVMLSRIPVDAILIAEGVNRVA